jgi:uncharacterized Zn-binding protein involved in type VI secretion
MTIGHFLGLGDKTSCGGKVLDADTTMMMFGFARAREGDRVSCGEDGETYQIIGGVPNMVSNGRRVAGTLDSVSSCPCRAKLIASNMKASYQSSNGPAPTQRAAAPVATSQPAAQQLAETTPANPVFTPAFKSRWGEEPGFYIVPQSMSREALMAELFDTFTPAASYRFLSLNPRWETVKAGTLVVLSDPANLQCTREERLLIEAADIANSALESLSPEEANFMMRHREEIATFLGYGSTAVGVGQVMFAQHLNGTKKLLEQIDELHRHSFQKYGHLRSPEFFAERKRLLAQLDAHLNGFLRKGIGLGDQPKLKKALGISSRSLVHHWSQAGVVDHIPGHATQISALTRASKIISAGGWIGTAVGGGASYLKVQEVCSAGNAAACERVKFTEGGSFLGVVGLGALGASGATLALGGVCIGIGVATAAVGGVACGLVVSGGGAFAGSWMGEKTGAFIGELIYEGVK